MLIHEAIFEAGPDALLVLDESGRVLMANQRLRQMCGASAAGAMDDALGSIARQLARTTEGPSCVAQPDGRVLEARVSTVQAQGDRPFMRVWSLREQSGRDGGALASDEHGDFLATASHELRTPLNAIIGFARAMERAAQGTLTDKQRKHLSYILDAGDRMLRLVNDLAELRTLDKRALQLEAVEVASVAREAIDAIKARAEEKGITLAVSTPPGLQLLGDRRAVLQVLDNLLSNAIKYTGGGGEVVVSAHPSGTSVVVGVRDNGVGVALADQAALFTYFQKLGAKHAHNMRGSGMGLAIVHALVRKHGGSVDVTSVPGEGSTFRASFKVAS